MNERFVFDRTEANPVKSSTSPFIKTTVVTSLITFTSKKTTTMTTTTSSPILATSSASQSSYEHESLSNFNVTVDSFGDAILVVSSSSSFIYRWMENNEVGGESVVPIKLSSDGYNPYGSCSAIFKGRVLLFGGEGRLSRSIQLLNGCSIIPIVGELPAPMSFHSCAVSFESVYLCGAWNDRRACYLFNDHTTRLIESTNSGHALSAMVSYRMYPVIIAGQDVYDEYTNKVEVYGGYNWKYGADLPTNLRFHTAIAVHEKIYVFGGYFYGIKDFVIEYDGYRWKRRSSLVEPRYDHSSIRIGSRIFHVGSSRTNMPIESWDAISGEHKDSASYLYGVKRPFLLPVTFSDYGPCV